MSFWSWLRKSFELPRVDVGKVKVTVYFVDGGQLDYDVFGYVIAAPRCWIEVKAPEAALAFTRGSSLLQVGKDLVPRTQVARYSISETVEPFMWPPLKEKRA